jgi:hypothetical protein
MKLEERTMEVNNILKITNRSLIDRFSPAVNI